MAGPRIVTYSTRVLGANPENVRRWSAAAARFGVASGAAVLFIVECIPRGKTDVFSKLPVVGDYWAAYRKEDEAQ
ncbi:hypothetical protein DFQ27_009009 [Actinomortierella ambigua]|uniref:Uncharacterized protein n=1 Tax=Actinomortierella ambigua TaxID=1343610 RepID=A0A9P6PQ51_9FUNG|nr:hypothetical protein DFQ27_009009 [Actinomortierella ambigua]